MESYQSIVIIPLILQQTIIIFINNLNAHDTYLIPWPYYSIWDVHPNISAHQNNHIDTITLQFVGIKIGDVTILHMCPIILAIKR